MHLLQKFGVEIYDAVVLVIKRYLPTDPPFEFVRRAFFGKHRIRLLLRSEIPA
jgi:hypothetical protein